MQMILSYFLLLLSRRLTSHLDTLVPGLLLLPRISLLRLLIHLLQDLRFRRLRHRVCTHLNLIMHKLPTTETPLPHRKVNGVSAQVDL